MQQSLFTKYFTICITITLAAITILGAIFMTLSGQYFKEDKYVLLTRNLTQAVAVTVRLPAAAAPAARSSTMRTVQSLPG